MPVPLGTTTLLSKVRSTTFRFLLSDQNNYGVFLFGQNQQRRHYRSLLDQIYQGVVKQYFKVGNILVRRWCVFAELSNYYTRTNILCTKLRHFRNVNSLIHYSLFDILKENVAIRG